MRKFLSIVLALMMALSMIAPATAEDAAKSQDIVILYTNDAHT